MKASSRRQQIREAYKEGAVISKVLNGTRYFVHLQWLLEDEGPYCRIYTDENLAEDSVVVPIIGFALVGAVREGGWDWVKNVKPLPIPMPPLLGFDGAYPGEWYLRSGTKTITYGAEVPAELRSIQVEGFCNYLVLETLLTSGENLYDYDHWMQYGEQYRQRKLELL